MTPQEKWNRLQNPTCIHDYGLSLTGAELRTFPDGRKLICDVLKEQRKRDKFSNLAMLLINRGREKMEKLAYDIVKSWDGKHET